MKNSSDNQCYLFEINVKKDDLFNKQFHELNSVITDNNHNSNNSAFFYKIE